MSSRNRANSATTSMEIWPALLAIQRPAFLRKKSDIRLLRFTRSAWVGSFAGGGFHIATGGFHGGGFHGGGFRAGSRKGYLAQCIRLAQRGYVAATVDYRLAPAAPFPAAVHDVKAAVRYLRANAARLGIDPERIGVTGGSAGGHLALFLGLTGGMPRFEGDGPNRSQSSRVTCVVDYYGPSDFTKSYGKSVDAAEVLPLFLGGDLNHARLTHIQASPLNWVTPDAAPTLAIQGTKDRYVAYEQSVWIIDRLLAAGVDAELETIDGADHGFKGADAERAEQRMLAFFDRYLKPR